MITEFRKNHILRFFAAWAEKPQAPLEQVLNQYLRTHKSIGSKDRKVVTEQIYAIIKWKSLIDAHLQQQHLPVNEENRLNFLLHNSVAKMRTAPFLKPHERWGVPHELYQRTQTSLGESRSEQFLSACQGRSPIFVRVNLQKTTREALLRGWENRYAVSCCEHSPAGIIFHEKINFFTLSEFQKGLFEVQDEGSQLIAELIDAKPGEEILDYCAGAGGKSLAVAPKLQGKGQIFLHDVREYALLSAKKRLRRCGIQNAQIIKTPKQLKSLKRRMNWVILDVPCTGSGTWRRRPDQRWRYSDAMLKRLLEQQREIFAAALPYVAPGGKIVYMTCSVFPEENEKQIAWFEKQFGIKPSGTPLKTFPEEGKMDGFYAQVICP